jgi:hypothetical protein
MEDRAMNKMHSILRRGIHNFVLIAVLAGAQSSAAVAMAQDVSFDFSRLVAYRDVTPPERLARIPEERLIEMKLPVSVRFQGLMVGEIELLDFEVDGSAAGIRVESYGPTTELAADATAVETITKTTKERSLGATLSGKLPVPVGPISCDVGPSVSAGMSRSNEATEKVKRIPPKRPVVVSGTFAEGRGVFFKFKPSPQTTFEGVHELTVTFAVPASWQGGGVHVTAAARGHKPRLWVEQPTVFTQVATVVQLYPEGNYLQRKAAARRLDAADADEHRGWGLGDLFLTSGSRG